MGNLAALLKHEGPGPHPGTGSSQDVHGGEGSRVKNQKDINAYDGWYESMGFNKSDHRALESYIGDDYQDINEALRGDFDLGEYEDEVRQLDDITSWSSAQEDITVYRGMPLYGNGSDDPDIRQIREMLKAKMDDPSRRFVFYDKAFLSTSVSVFEAEQFATYEGEDMNPAIFQIKAPKGTKCAPINPGEFEVLFPREAKFEITSVTTKNGWWYIEMTPYAEGK